MLTKMLRGVKKKKTISYEKRFGDNWEKLDMNWIL